MPRTSRSMETMEGKQTSRNRKSLLLLGLVGAIAAAFYIFPPFRVVSLEEAKRKTATEHFNPKEFSERFWNERLLKSLDHAVDAATLVAAIDQNPENAKRQYGRQLGLSSVYYYFAKGEGRIVAINHNEIVLELSGARSNTDLMLVTANVSGNAVRDATGLIDVNSFPNSREFNQIATELNQRVEATVLPPFRQQAVVGATVMFVGCVQIEDEANDLHPLKLIPIQASIK